MTRVCGVLYPAAILAVGLGLLAPPRGFDRGRRQGRRLRPARAGRRGRRWFGPHRRAPTRAVAGAACKPGPSLRGARRHPALSGRRSARGEPPMPPLRSRPRAPRHPAAVWTPHLAEYAAYQGPAGPPLAGHVARAGAGVHRRPHQKGGARLHRTVPGQRDRAECRARDRGTPALRRLSGWKNGARTASHLPRAAPGWARLRRHARRGGVGGWRAAPT